MRTLPRLLLAAPLLLLACACTSATPPANTPAGPPAAQTTTPATGGTAAPGQTPATVGTADSTQKPNPRLRIPDAPSAQDRTFDHVRRACDAAAEIGKKRPDFEALARTLAVPAAGGDRDRNGAIPPVSLAESLRTAQATLAAVEKAETPKDQTTPPPKPAPGNTPPPKKPVAPGGGKTPAPRTPPVQLHGDVTPPPAPPPGLADFVRDYRVFLDEVNAINNRCASLQVDLRKGAIADFHFIRDLSDDDLTALVAQQRVFGEDFSFETAKNALALTKLREGGRNAADNAAASSGLPGLGSLENTLIQGLADFLVTRSKAEAVLWVQERIAAELCKDENPGETQDGPRLPHTCSALKDLSPELSLQAMGNYLQAAALSDLEELPLTILSGSMTGSTVTDAEKRDLAAALRLGILVAREVYAGKSPLDVLRSVQRVVCGKDADAASFGGIAEAACRASTLVDSIARQRRNVASVSAQTPAAVGKLALAALTTATKALGSEGALDKLDAPCADTMLADVESLVADVEAVEADLSKVLTSANGGKVPATARLAITSRAIGAFVRAARATAGLAADATCDANKGVATSPVTKALSAVEAAADFASAVFNHDAAGLGLAAQAALAAMGSDPKWAPLQKVLPLVVELASAKKSADVAAALEAAAAPVGSYKMKFQRPQIAVNAFVGASLAAETTKSWQFSGALALYAPVGLHMTTPCCGKSPAVHFGAFVSILDLGALTSARLSDEVGLDDQGQKSKVETPPVVGFAQVFSPGLFATMGIPYTPIVFGAGISATPSLRKQVPFDTTAKPQELPVVRGQVFLALDLTLLPL